MQEDLTAEEINALHEALDDEYRARAIYGQVLADFGDVRPFSNIVEAETRHIEALRVLFARYGLSFPEDPWPGKVERYASVREACAAGVEAEIANAALYDRLKASTRRPDILAVFGNLQAASQERHLPAFQRCAQRSGQGAGRGTGGGRRMRRRRGRDLD